MTDIISTVSTAVTLALRLKDISKNIENAEFKNILADLSLELSEVKLKLADLLSENAELKEKIHTITSATGTLCPSCNNRTYKLISSEPDPVFGDLGANSRLYKCSSCNFSETVMSQ
ncbi:hypothetical protein [Pseudomonas batumici]|uniref:hypothetical protein n=1 Tax=Pseudomonas batumici TaxID=226910 RepID=UPI000589D252|nr:hypothetical protein [Pseudomonas batumici]